MPAYLLTWNPLRYDKRWSREAGRLARGQRVSAKWATGVNKSIKPGDRLFFVRVGNEPRGIFASAVATSGSYQGEHWDLERAARGEVANYVDFVFEALLDPDRDPLFDPRSIPALRSGNWSPQGSGAGIKEKFLKTLEASWNQHLHTRGRAAAPKRVPPKNQAMLAVNGLPSLDAEAEANEMPEGAVRWRYTLHRQRESRLRSRKLAEVLARQGRLVCEVPGCGFDFHDFYGELGRDFAHVHHLRPLASRAKPEATRLEELAVVCANCHAMIHRGGLNRPLESLIPWRSRGRKRVSG